MVKLQQKTNSGFRFCSKKPSRGRKVTAKNQAEVEKLQQKTNFELEVSGDMQQKTNSVQKVAAKNKLARSSLVSLTILTLTNSILNLSLY